MFQIFQFGNQPVSNTAALVASDTPSGIVRSCMDHLLASVFKKDKELVDSIQFVLDSLPEAETDEYLKEVLMDEHVRVLSLACSRVGQPKLFQAVLIVIEKLISCDLLIGNGLAEESPSLNDETEVAPSDLVITPGQTPPLSEKLVIDVIVGLVCPKSIPGDEETQLLIIRCILSLALTRSVHGLSLMTCVRTLFAINKDSSKGVSSAQSTAVAALTQILNQLVVRIESSSPPTPALFASCYARTLLHKAVLLSDSDNSEKDDRAFCSHKCKTMYPPTTALRRSGTGDLGDVITVFSSLCKLAGQTSASGGIPDGRIVKAKRLSLELILAMLHSAGPRLKRNVDFLEILKKKLFISLIANSVSPIGAIYTVSLQILDLLISEFKVQLWPEIGLFIDQVFLCILNSENASDFHKAKVLQVFRSRLCCDCSSAIELFLLFDCNFEERNVFELCVASLAKLAAAHPAALDALVDLVDSAHAWTLREPKLAEPLIEEVPQNLEVKLRKTILQEGIVLFNSKSPRKGLEFLSSFFEIENPQSVVEFLQKTPNLSKTALGELFGENDPFSLSVFYAFVDTVHLGDLDLDVALRRFLAQFRLPGEAQKIDRIMEKFAEKFTRENPHKYPSADSAYVLSFAVIMLNTDLHSEQIKRKMTVEEFVKLGSSAGVDIDPEELVRLYKNILAEPISLTEDKHRDNKDVMSVSQERRRFELFLRETGLMIEKSKEQIILKKNFKNPQSSLADIAPMFAVVTGSICEALAANSGLPAALKAAVKLCEISVYFDSELIGFPAFALLLNWAAALSLDVAVTETQLGAIDAVFRFATHNVLSSGWEKIAKISSQIDKLALIQTTNAAAVVGVTSKYSLWPKPAAATGVVQFVVSAVAIENSKLVENSLIDSLVLRSTNLSPANLLALLAALIEVSLNNELPEERLFSCQKIAEICDFNMNRIRLVWTKIWALVAPYFVRVAAGDGPRVMFAIDSLRQLALKFLSKPELENYHFQSDFLKPFHLIFAASSLLDVQELVLSVIQSLVQSVAQLKSGWISVFDTVQLAAGVLPVQTFALILLVPDQVQTEYYSAYFGTLIGLIENRRFEPEIASVWDLVLAKIPGKNEPNQSSKFIAVFRGLSKLVTDPRGEIRERAVTVLIDAVPTNGSTETVQILLRAVLSPLFDDITQLVAEGRMSDVGAIQVLTQICTKLGVVADTYFEPFFSNFVAELISLFSVLINSVESGEKIAAVGTSALRRLIVNNFDFISAEGWKTIVEGISRLMTSTTPADLMQVSADLESLPFQPSEMVTRCVTQLNLIQVVQEIVTCAEMHSQPGLASVESSESQGTHHPDVLTPLPLTAASRLIQSLESSYEFAVSFNGEIQLRDRLKKLGFMKDLRQLPGLLKQERGAISSIIRLCFVSSIQFSARLDKYSNQVVAAYLSKEAQLHTISPQASLSEEIEREIGGLIPLVSGIILGGILKMRKNEFEPNRDWIFHMLVKLIASNNSTIRCAVQKCLLTWFI